MKPPDRIWLGREDMPGLSTWRLRKVLERHDDDVEYVRATYASDTLRKAINLHHMEAQRDLAREVLPVVKEYLEERIRVNSPSDDIAWLVKKLEGLTK